VENQAIGETSQVWIELMAPNNLAKAVVNLRAAMVPAAIGSCGESIFDSGKDCSRSAKEPMSL
jgi:hypothetical protein